MGGVSMEWKEVRLGDVCSIQRGASPRPIQKFISKEGMPWVKIADATGISSRYISSTSEYIIKEGISKSRIVHPGDLIVSNSATPGLPKFMAIEACVHDGWLIIRDLDGIDKVFLYYVFINIRRRLSNQANGSVFMNLKTDIVKDFVIKLPMLDDQRRIASILSSLDRKIELNNKINADLEEMAQAIFKNWFVDFEPFKDGKFVDSELGMIPEGWKVGRLTEIASYMNGLAMQKFPPENNEDSLPVLKIKELGQGFCGTDSDRCSCNIKDECIIHNGDVIFSWSGTLLVDVWCGGDCGLNQHLFKVTSKDYPKWFYYYWTKHHLQEFIHIAKDKAVTMGHIKRGHLEEAMVAIPDNDSMEKAHELFEPILSKMISLRLENSRLSLLRDTLLPRLMSGELEVPE